MCKLGLKQTTRDYVRVLISSYVCFTWNNVTWVSEQNEPCIIKYFWGVNLVQWRAFDRFLPKFSSMLCQYGLSEAGLRRSNCTGDFYWKSNNFRAMAYKFSSFTKRHISRRKHHRQTKTLQYAMRFARLRKSSTITDHTLWSFWVTLR